HACKGRRSRRVIHALRAGTAFANGSVHFSGEFAMMQTIATLVSWLCVAQAAPHGKGAAVPARDIEARTLSALQERDAKAVRAVALAINSLGDAERRRLPIRIRTDAVEFRFRGDFPGKELAGPYIEFLLSHPDRAYESLFLIDKTENERLQRLGKAVRDLSKAEKHVALTFKLAWADKGGAHVEDVEDILRLVDAQAREAALRALAIGPDGLRIDNVKIDPAALPLVRQPSQMLIIIRPAFLEKR